MRADNGSYKYLVNLVFTGTLILIIMGFNNDAKSIAKGSNNDFKYDGTYSLYVKLKDTLSFQWITNTIEKGYYEVLNENDKIVFSGETDSSRIHKVVLGKLSKGHFLEVWQRKIRNRTG